MPDKWEFPWYASWDLAFHCIPLALVDVQFAKAQLDLTVFSVLAPVVEEEPVPVALEGAATGPEVITEKKPEGEAAAGATPVPVAKEKEQKK